VINGVLHASRFEPLTLHSTCLINILNYNNFRYLHRISTSSMSSLHLILLVRFPTPSHMHCAGSDFPCLHELDAPTLSMCSTPSLPPQHGTSNSTGVLELNCTPYVPPNALNANPEVSQKNDGTRFLRG